MQDLPAFDMVAEDLLRGGFNAGTTTVSIVEASPSCVLVGSNVSFSCRVGLFIRLELAN